MNKALKYVSISIVTSIILWIALYFLLTYIVRTIGCDCGSGTYFEGRYMPTSCGCATSVNFSRTFGPLVYIVPILTFVVMNIVFVLKGKKKQ